MPHIHAILPRTFAFGFMHSIRLSISLMVAGLLLLLAFLALFLRNAWKDEADNLRRELRLQLVDAIRQVEHSSLEQVPFNIHRETPDSLDVRIDLGSGTRRMRFFTLEEEKVGNILKWESDSNSKVQIKIEKKSRNNETEANPPLDGFLSALLNDNQSNMQDSALLMKVLTENLPPLERKEKTALITQIVYLGTDSIPIAKRTGNAFIAASYHDFPSNAYYGLQVDKYKGYLFQKILPELLFSLLLFTCVSLAFGLIYRNFRAQQRLSDMKNEFISNMTHELKTPISTVNVAIEALQHFDALSNPQRMKEYLDISRQEVNRLSLLVDKVLRVSQFEQGALLIKPDATNIRNLFEEVLQAMKLQFEKYNATVHFTTEGHDFVVRVDRLHLSSVLYNLLDNALKYSLVNPEINVRLWKLSGQEVAFSVQDAGPGIPRAFQSRIFEKFFRIPHGDVHNVKGHGLGLSYVARVIDLHGGKIQLESAEGRGTRFEIHLPINT